jgi:hypothetical protein
LHRSLAADDTEEVLLKRKSWEGQSNGRTDIFFNEESSHSGDAALPVVGVLPVSLPMDLV